MTQQQVQRTYAGWQHEQVAFAYGLSVRRAVLVAGGVVAVLQPIASHHLGSAVVAWPVAVVLVGMACLRIAGRTVEEWAMTAVNFAWLSFRRRNRFLSGAFTPGGAAEDGAPEMDLPGVLAPLRILHQDQASGAPPMAVIHHPHERTYAAVAEVSFPGIGLTDSQRREDRVAAWGGVLAALCVEGHPIARLHLVHRAVPEHGEGLRAWHTDHLDPSAPLASVLAAENLLATAAPTSSQRHTYLVAVVDARRAHLAIRGAGGGDTGACAVLAREAKALASTLAGADVQVVRWLSPRDVAAVMRTAFDPDAARVLDARHAAATTAAARGQEPPGLLPGVDPALAGPAAAESVWAHYRHDGAISVTYAVHGWPVSAVHATALTGLLAESPHRRSLALVYEPLGPRDAARKVQAERTKREVAVRLRQRSGQAITAVERAEMVKAAEQDAERAAGHGLVRFTGYLTVTVTDPDQLDDACADLQACAATAGVELRRMYGAQDVGFACTLPVGLGLPKTRW